VTANEFRILQFFIQSAGRIITRAELSKNFCHSASRSVDNHILRLRQKLERDPSCPIHFLTVRGVGYRFVR
jgi:DNA-binding response OmpR family regulator